jgi:hypothetical protein
MKKIKLTQGKFALVDDVDFDWLNQWKWYTRKSRKTFYAQRNSKTINGVRHLILMHRVILRPSIKKQVDHKDENGLNNQRNNIRICTIGQNNHNHGKTIKNTSGFKGVSWFISANKWGAVIGVNGKQKYLGLFSSKIKASEAYIKACKKYHGEFANY